MSIALVTTLTTQYEAFGWRACFLIQLPIAIPATLGFVWLVRIPGSGKAHVDWAGAFSSVIAIGALVTSLQLGSDRLGFGHPVVVAGFVVAACGFAGFGFAERRAIQPILEPKLLRNKTVLLVALAKCVDRAMPS